MHEAELFVALLAAVILAALAVRRLEHVPYAVVLVIGGIVAGLLPFAPEVRLDPDVIFAVFLPPILYPSAFAFAFEDVRQNLRPIGLLAFGLVLATVGAIAVAAHVVVDLPWAAAFVLGAILAPTDPVAATAVIRSSGAPGRLATILEGESLVNDGTSLTALKIAIAAVGGSFSVLSSGGRFVLVAFGGMAIGAVLGWLVAQLRRRLDELELEAALAVLLAYGAFLLAERLEVSGVLAVVFAGYVTGRSEEISSPATRVGGESFWAVVRFLSESILFLLVGLAFAQTLDDPATRGTWELVGDTALVVAVAVGVRVLWMFTVPHLAGVVDPTTRRFRALVGPRARAVIGFGGLRGAISVAAALSVPAAVQGTEFPERSTLVAVSIAAIVVLLVVPALVLPSLLRLTGLAGSEDAESVEARARAALADAALESLDGAADDPDVPERALDRVRERYEVRVRRYAQLGEVDGDADGDRGRDEARGHTAAYRDLARRAVAAERARLTELRRDGQIHGELLRELEHDLDVEELRLR